MQSSPERAASHSCCRHMVTSLSGFSTNSSAVCLVFRISGRSNSESRIVGSTFFETYTKEHRPTFKRHSSNSLTTGLSELIKMKCYGCATVICSTKTAASLFPHSRLGSATATDE